MGKKWAYYNDVDPKACEWVRQLIKLGEIAPGEVDERSITNIDPTELRSFSQIHLFCGIAVWSYSLRQAGWDDDREILSGSCPCQPFSSAGKQAGTTDDRHLWPHMHRIIRELQPQTIIGEQVASKAALTWWDIVAGDLENENYAAAAFDLPGGSAGAPHVRSRLFWVANKLGNTPSDRQQRKRQSGTTQERQESQSRPRRQLPEGSQRPSTIINMAHTSSPTSTISIDRVSSSRDKEIRRDSSTENHSRSSASLPATFWDECEWVECRDGKYRPTGIGINPLAGVPSVDKEFTRGELERCSEILLSDWNDRDTSEKAQMFARLIFETRNWGSVMSRLRSLVDGATPDLDGSSNAGRGGDCQKQKFRTMKLKGIGNSLVIPVAVEFISSVMEIFDADPIADTLAQSALKPRQ